MRFLALVIVLGASTAPDGLAQTKSRTGSVRLVEVRAEPEEPSFGEAFDLHLTLRVRPGVIVFLPDTLVPTYAVQSVGPGMWTEAPAPGDSVGIRATYPVIGFGEGRVDLPSIEFWIRPAGAGQSKGAGAVRRVAEARAGPRAGFERRVIRLGAIEVGPFLAMADSGAILAPRPPADVLGGGWSLSLLLAVSVVSVVGLFGAGVIARRWWAATLAARLHDRSPRQEALRELERIRALGWHRNGRMDDFYASSTGTLRRFAALTDPAWGAALTSTELITRLAKRWGPGGVESLTAAIAVAERVKFGALQRDAEAAEGDWGTIFNWIRDAPEG